MMSAHNNIEEIYERLVSKWEFSLVLPFNIFISLDFSTSIPSIKEVHHIGWNRHEVNRV